MKTIVKRALVLACMFAATISQAEEAYPTRPIKWVVGTSAGGGTDIVARTVGLQLQKQLGQSIIVDNKPGGGTTIAADFVSKSPADGYTLLTADVGTIVFNTALFKKLSYEPTQDFTAVGMLARIPLLLAVNPATGFDDPRKLVAAMRANPEKFPVATAGIGSPHHIALEFLNDQAQLKVTHVPYKGAAPAVQDVIAGVSPVIVVDAASGMANIKAGKLKVLATFTAERLPSMPEVPSLVQLGLIQREPSSWLSVVVPSKTPPHVVERLSLELQKAMSDLAVQARLKNMGVEPLATTSAQMKQQWSLDMATWPPLIRQKGISLD